MSLSHDIGGIVEEALLLLPMRAEPRTQTQKYSYSQYEARLLRRWEAAWLGSHDDPTARSILLVVGAQMGFRNPGSGRVLKIDETTTSLLSVLG